MGLPIFARTKKMSLHVNHLTKMYGRQRAVDDVSFAVEKGEIVGFLGPNGAGKSTTMKIATTYLPPTEGSVLVNGMNVEEQPLKIRKTIGYLPEHNPLYLDMYVHEYLRFIGGVYKLDSDHLKKRVGEVVEMCGLEREQNKPIEALSKGYRQRVGLAQALIHNPDVLILDEPTSGLDPNQILEIRKLIRQISQNKTVIFSTHIMQEVQALCNRVIVINKGKIVADDQLSNLMKGNANASILVVEFQGEISTEELKQLKGVRNVIKEGAHYKFFSDEGVDVRAELFRYATEKKISILSLKEEQNSLEEIFRSLTNGAV
jgi:ABC-2 type transport system ATP-binding protein